MARRLLLDPEEMRFPLPGTMGNDSHLPFHTEAERRVTEATAKPAVPPGRV
jgi:hypothetical protein